MDLKECLTNEKIRKKFTSQFDLVNYAIRLAENMISTGRDPRVKIDSQNRSLQVLSEILNNKDKFDEIIVEPVEVEYVAPKYIKEEPSERLSAKSSERKKVRKVAAK